MFRVLDSKGHEVAVCRIHERAIRRCPVGGSVKPIRMPVAFKLPSQFVAEALDDTYPRKTKEHWFWLRIWNTLAQYRRICYVNHDQELSPTNFAASVLGRAGPGVGHRADHPACARKAG